MRASEQQRTVGNPVVEQPGLLQLFDEEWQLAERRHRCGGVPFHVHAPGKGIGNRRMLRNFRLLTRRVNRQTSLFCAHAGQICQFSRGAQSLNCRI